ncbi:DUF488 family protein [Halopelagius fulvigenes]|uniref:DUF488 family protein n=1 Tax=Halopelagius fulvigenes TaxID=1198324 RepID=A0ABD5TXK0_9EURY
MLYQNNTEGERFLARLDGSASCRSAYLALFSTPIYDPSVHVRPLFAFIEEFVSALRNYGVTVVVDVRRFPGSRRNPQFGAHALAATLDEHGIGYRHFEALGGRRSSPRTDSPNGEWENESSKRTLTTRSPTSSRRHSTSWSRWRTTKCR